jgi:hypothetical protein
MAAGNAPRLAERNADSTSADPELVDRRALAFAGGQGAGTVTS